jgi:hypothetical protein
MSTKIHNGFELLTDDLLEIQNLIVEMRGREERIADLEASRNFANRAAKLMDLDAIGKRPAKLDGGNPASAAYLEFKAAERATIENGRRDPFHDHAFSIVIIPTKGRTLGIAFTEKHERFAAMLEHPLVKEYAYWNNSDPPENISHEEWDERGRTWDEALPTGIPASSGLSADIISGYRELSLDDGIPFIASARTRAAEIAKNAVVEERFENLRRENAEINEQNEEDIRNGFEFVIEAMEFLETMEGRGKVEAITDEIVGKLIETPTKEDLTKPFEKT